MRQIGNMLNQPGRGFVLVLAFAVFWLWNSAPQELHSQVTSNSAPSSMHVLTSTLANGTQQVIIVDEQLASMAAYQVDAINGHIRLTSVRSVDLDLQMQQFNTETPLPSELSAVQP